MRREHTLCMQAQVMDIPSDMKIFSRCRKARTVPRHCPSLSSESTARRPTPLSR